MKNLNLIKTELAGFYGTSQFYRRFNPNSVYTDGIKHLLSEADAQWLYDIIETTVFLKLKSHNIPDNYYLQISVKKDSDKMDMKLVDYKGNVLWKRHIDYTDFPYGDIELVCGWDGIRLTTCLHSEN